MKSLKVLLSVLLNITKFGLVAFAAFIWFVMENLTFGGYVILSSMLLAALVVKSIDVWLYPENGFGQPKAKQTDPQDTRETKRNPHTDTSYIEAEASGRPNTKWDLNMDPITKSV